MPQWPELHCDAKLLTTLPIVALVVLGVRVENVRQQAEQHRFAHPREEMVQRVAWLVVSVSAVGVVVVVGGAESGIEKLPPAAAARVVETAVEKLRPSVAAEAKAYPHVGNVFS